MQENKNEILTCKKISYISSWNFFSKSLFLKKNIKNKCQLLIVETQKDLEQYEKIFDFLNTNFRVLDNIETLGDLIINKKWFFIASLEQIENIKLDKKQLNYLNINIEIQKKYNFLELTKKLIDFNYKFSDFDIKSSFKRFWDIIRIITNDEKVKYEISFWWDEVEEIRVNGDEVEQINIWKNEIIETSENSNKDEINNFLELVDEDIFILLDNLNFSNFYDYLTEKLKNFCCFDYVQNNKLKIVDLGISTIEIKDIIELKNKLKTKLAFFYTKNPKIIKNFIDYNQIKNTEIVEVNLACLKSFETQKEMFICDDIIKNIFTKKRLKRNISIDLDLMLKIKPWDYVVHIEHWIWIFKQIVKKNISSNYDKKNTNEIVKEYIEIQYKWEDKLFVPISEVSRVNKYLWVENPSLTSLGWNSWENKIKKANKQAQQIAWELIEIYANRKIKKWFNFIWDKEKENHFRNSFPHIYTNDQSDTINEILEDMNKSIPMDRLIVWDVWFWKTEVAFNAIYRSFLNKKQSILIVPLVILAYEHFEKSKQRFGKFGVKIAILTRLESIQESEKIINKLSLWEIDLIIWTHKILSDKIRYKNLGLIVTDEEHRFWVKDKEKIKKLKNNIDSLAMSATPIPRSLNMALSNLRQISILKNPPHGRQNIDTIINRFSENIIKTAWEKEFERNGQIFFVHNRISNIENIKTILQNIFKEKKIVVAHWKLAWIEMEKRIIDFKNKKFDILLSTTVIENWIDFSNVNTIIINNAESFWLSQIHQLRWRVWRSNKKWYCYLLYKSQNIKPETWKRLKTIAKYSYLWAWFELAMKDLEIRWGWDLLGFRQSGQESSIWINLYLKLIEEKIEQLQKSKNTVLEKHKKIETKIDLDLDIFISDNFFSWELDKINFYREIELIKDLEELEQVKKDLVNHNNKIDDALESLFNLLELKILASKYLIEEIKRVWINYQIDFNKDISLEELKNFLNKDKQVKFKVINLNRLRSSTKNFANNKNFIEYMLSLFKGKNLNSKIKLKWRNY